jgi:hypothetical protein
MTVFLSLTARDASTSQTCNGQVGCRMQLLSRLLVKKCRSAPETFSRDTAFSGLGDSPLA